LRYASLCVFAIDSISRSNLHFAEMFYLYRR
jgi:hypothetical protein